MRVSSQMSAVVAALALCLWASAFQESSGTGIVTKEIVSTNPDLSIGRFVDGSFMIFRFGHSRIARIDVRPKFFFVAAQFSQGGDRIVGYKGGRFTILSRGLDVIWERSVPPMWERSGSPGDVGALAISPDGNKVIFEMSDRQGRMDIAVLPREGPEEAVFSGPTRYPAPVLTWDRESSRVAFDAEGKVYIFELASGALTTIADGTVPTWSPDGRTVAYRAPSGQAELLSVASGVSNPVQLHEKSTTAMLHWSPDSKYVFVREEPSRPPAADCLASGRFVVYRLSDLASEVFFDPCGFRDSSFGWLSGTAAWVQSASNVASNVR